MKIVLASNTAWYLWKFRLTLAQALREAGHEVVAVAPRDGYVPKLEEAGVRFIPLPMDNAGTNPVRDLLFLFRLLRLLRRERPGVYLGYTIKPNVYGGMACRWLGIPSIHNVSGLGTAFMKKGVLSRIACLLYRTGLGRATRVFFQNNEDRSEFVGLGLAPENITDVLPGSGVDLERFASRYEHSGEKPGPVRFILIARLIWDKGIGEYVAAARQLQQEGIAAKFQLAGFLEVKNRTAVSRTDVDSWVREGVIEYLGETDDVRAWMAQADCVVLPSYREGTPRSLLEAASMAKPVITTDAPGCRNVVKDGVSGFLCQVRDADDLADKMRRIANMTAIERAKMGRAGRAKMEREYDEHIVLDRYLEEVSKLTSGKSSQKITVG